MTKKVKIWPLLAAASVLRPLFLERNSHILYHNTIHNWRQRMKIVVFRRIITEQVICGEQGSHLSREPFLKNPIATGQDRKEGRSYGRIKIWDTLWWNSVIILSVSNILIIKVIQCIFTMYFIASKKEEFGNHEKMDRPVYKIMYSHIN